MDEFFICYLASSEYPASQVVHAKNRHRCARRRTQGRDSAVVARSAGGVDKVRGRNVPSQRRDGRDAAFSATDE